MHPTRITAGLIRRALWRHRSSHVKQRWVLLGIIVLSFVTLTSMPVSSAATTADYLRIIEDEAYWVSTAQLSCTGDGQGAIAEATVRGSAPVSIHPYEANLGARAMLAAGPRYFPMVKSYIQWYLGHMNRPDDNGVYATVYDYDYNPLSCTGVVQPNPETGAVPKYDSTDAYAGTFLSLVKEYAAANPADNSYFRSPQVRDDLESIANVIDATTGPNHLSAATPTHHAQYLLDNVEAQQGTQDYSWLLSNVLGDAAGASQRVHEAALMRNGIEIPLWQASRTPGMYGWAADQVSPSWSTWYPDSIDQVWPLWNQLSTPKRRSTIWTALTAHWPAWERSTPSYGSVSVDHDPNADIAYAAALVGDKTSVDAYLNHSQTNWTAAGRPPPWTVVDSAFRALAAKVGNTL